MKNRFPHLTEATQFPGNDGNVFGQYPNDFSYDRWGVGTKITVCRVPWDLDRNVVDWGTQDKILEYFHGLDTSSSFKLESEMNREPDGSIRLPIPISNLKKYNYLFVEYTTPTSTEQPLDYANTERQPFIGFFMRDFRYVAPSTTEAALDTDWWTTTITSLQVQNLMLERGHAPMAAISVDDYLSDPLHNNRYLLTSDVSFGEPSITTASQFESWMATTEPLMVLAVSSTLQQIQAMLAKKDVSGKNTAPTFSNDGARWGREYKVNGYSWAGVSSYKDAEVRSTPWSTSTGLPTGVTMIAVKVKAAKSFLDYVQTNSPELFSVIQSCFLIPGSLVASTEAGTYGGVALYELKPLEQLPPVPVTLEKEDFGYPTEYSKIAKLYTYPYAGLTFSDNNGRSVDVRIEYTSSIAIHRRVSLAYPYLRAQAFLSGVNGSGSTSYEWIDASGIKRSGSMPEAEWTETLLEFDIPTYALTQSSYSQYVLQNSTTAEQERLKALQAYHNEVRSLNQGTENSKDAADTAHDNGIRSNDTSLANGKRSNDTSLANTKASNATAYSNTTASNLTSYNNAVASANQGYTNSERSASTAKGNSNRSAEAARQAITNSTDAATEKLGYRNDNADKNYDIGKTKLWATNNQNISLQRKIMGPLVPSTTLNQFGAPYEYDEVESPGPWWSGDLFTTKSWSISNVDGDKMRELVDHADTQTLLLTKSNQANWYTSQIAQIKTLQSTANSLIESVSSAASTESAASGGFSAPIGAAVSTARLLANTGISNEEAKAQWLFNTNEVFYDLAQNYSNMEKQLEYAELMNGGVDKDGERSVNLEAMYKSKEQSKTLDKKTTERDNQLAGKNGDLAQTTSNNNATDAYNAAEKNADESRNTSNANSLASKNTADSNALASKNTSDSNAQASHDATDTNLQKSWDATRLNLDASQKVTKENAVFSQDASLLNAQQSLALAQQLWQMGAENHKTDSPITRGSFSGDPTMDLWGQRGVEIRVKTQPLGAIASAGSEMLRYGYRLDQSWTFTGWSVMKHFSYWRCKDVWLTPSSAFAELGKTAVRAIIEEGVTIWRRPEEIGTVPVTDNWED